MTLESDIELIPLRFDFYRYLSVRIIAAGLPQVGKADNPAQVFAFTPQAQELVKQFIEYAVSVWNQAHVNQKTTPQEAADRLNEWWKADAIQYQKEQVLAN
ncbi:MAG: hypothetical protein ACREAY_01290 [Nitrososphaera sp.]|uniref:hypothetical protein n=1 Tax=Nitrososphaera sp. TaxID=1971748 RepID=UPI003D6FCC6D